MFGLLVGSAAVEALNKWTRTPRESGLPPPQFLGTGYYPREICEDIGSHVCNLVHFGVKK